MARKIPAIDLSLVADIGGTNTRIALAHNGLVDRTSIRRFKNSEMPSFNHIISLYLDAQKNPNCVSCCIAAAGPVHNDQVQMTNIDWFIDGARLAQEFRINSVTLMNDLRAFGYCLHGLGGAHVTPILTPAIAPDPKGTKLVIAAGTGINIAVAHPIENGKVFVPPAEFGHSSLPMHNDKLFALCNALPHDGAYCSIEDVLSGQGFLNLYRQLCAQNNTSPLSKDQAWQALGELKDANLIIAAQYFTKLLADLVVDQSLCHLPFGGIYLAGGVAQRLAPHLNKFGFSDAFHTQDKKTDLVAAMGVSLINDDAAALKGCARFLVQG